MDRKLIAGRLQEIMRDWLVSPVVSLKLIFARASVREPRLVCVTCLEVKMLLTTTRCWQLRRAS
jgi:hypothetical protein